MVDHTNYVIFNLLIMLCSRQFMTIPCIWDRVGFNWERGGRKLEVGGWPKNRLERLAKTGEMGG